MLLIPSLKGKTKYSDISTIADSKDFYMPLDAYRNVMTPVVSIGERVKKYQLLAQSEGTFASKLHAPVSGTVTAFFQLNGKQMIHLQNDFLNLETLTFPVEPTGLTKEEFMDVLLDNGIQGAGGSQFPTQLKYNIQDRQIRTVIFNGAECEPYLTSDFVLMREKADELIKAAQVIRTVLNAQKIVFAVERHNIAVRKILLKNASNLGVEIEVKILSDGYPQGGELQLIKSVTGLEIRKGSFPADHGILVNNIGTLWAIYKALFEGRPNIERIITVSGNGCQHLGNYRIKIGTPIIHILRETNNNWNPDLQTIVLGGAMMGKSVESPLVPVHKGSGGLLIMRKTKIEKNNCIKCGLCVDVCPQHLMPLEFVRHNLSSDVPELKKFSLQDCIECGACAYVCPSDVPLMENIFDGKKKLFQ
ncbi:electron transport complex subunit RsxC [Pontibacter harenae]|uniref:electron transport complex subunit RsxC n=1 Tax=Pontibacter harenae TaxID=2894083 RepID=UPI001E65DF66|nr:electron transport complex subunit RsxC [Pontibacter harenae]MCC9167734.1 electron transport complex subunit RsxC [Pontibacter harenae]